MSQGATSEAQSSEHTEIGEEIYALAARIFPICRSITGNGVHDGANPQSVAAGGAPHRSQS
jgi:aminopeptidase-like protein